MVRRSCSALAAAFGWGPSELRRIPARELGFWIDCAADAAQMLREGRR